MSSMPRSALAVLEIQFVRHAELLGLIGSRGRPADVDEPIGVGVRQPLEEHDLDEAEDRRARSDGERERRDDDEREARRAGQTARRMREVPGPFLER